MSFWIASAPRRPFARAFAPIACTVALVAAALAAASPAWAQAPAPKAQPKAQPKAAPQPAPAAPAPSAAPGAPAEPQLTYSPWTKVCPPKAADPNAHQICFTGRDGRLPDGFMVVGVTLMEQEGTPDKILRVTINTPVGLLVHPSARVAVIVDQGQPMTAPLIACSIGGCITEYEASQELVDKLKKGQSIIVQAVTPARSPFSVAVPLPDFAKAYAGPPTDMNALEEQQKKLQDELQKRAEEARKKLEGQQPPATR